MNSLQEMFVAKEKFKTARLIFEEELLPPFAAQSMSGSGLHCGIITATGQLSVFNAEGQSILSLDLRNQVSDMDLSDSLIAVLAGGSLITHTITGEVLFSKPVFGRPLSISVAPRTDRIAIGTMDGRIHLFNAHGQFLRSTELNEPLISVAQAGSAGTIAAAGKRGSIFYLKPAGELEWNYLVDLTVRGVSITTDGQYVLASSFGRKLLLLHRAQRVEWSVELKYFINCAAISGDGKYMVVGTREGAIVLLNRDAQTVWEEKVNDEIESVHIDEEGTAILASTRMGRILYYRVTDGEEAAASGRESFIEIEHEDKRAEASTKKDVEAVNDKGETLMKKDFFVDYPCFDGMRKGAIIALAPRKLIVLSYGRETLVVFDENGSVLWKFMLPQGRFMDISVDPVSLVTVVSAHTGVYALKKDGTLWWCSRIPGARSAMGQGFVASVSSDARMVLLSLDGHEISSSVLSEWVISHEVLGDRIFVLDEGGVKIFDLQAELIRKVDFRAGQRAMTVDSSSGRIYVCTDSSIFFMDEKMTGETKIFERGALNLSVSGKNLAIIEEKRATLMDQAGNIIWSREFEVTPVTACPFSRSSIIVGEGNNIWFGGDREEKIELAQRIDRISVDNVAGRIYGLAGGKFFRLSLKMLEIEKNQHTHRVFSAGESGSQNTDSTGNNEKGKEVPREHAVFIEL